MSNQFVQEPNQNMLWKIVNSTAQLSEFFRVLPPGTTEEWFKGIIHQVYGETYGRNVPLRDINKRALDAMLESIQVLKKRQQTSLSQQAQLSQQQQAPLSQQQQQQPQTSYQQLQSSVQSSSAFRDSRENQMMDQFNRRQAEYDSMTKKPAPTPVFNDSIKDEAIQDISKAVSEYMSLRDADIMVPTASAGTPSPASPTLVGPSRIQIAEAISITLDEHEPSNYQKKQVQWGENTEHVFDKTQSIYETALMKKIQSLEEKMDAMVTKMDQIIVNLSVTK